MKIAIHHRKKSFSDRWIEYCRENEVPHKIVDCYRNNIIQDVEDCDALMWHFHHTNPKDVLFAKQLTYSLQAAGKKVFPDFNTAWHFDDKVGQKYLLEALDAPLVPTYVFYDKEKALKWIEETNFPKVFKLRRGSGSSHVQLIKDRNSAKKIVKKSFGKGYKQYDAWTNLAERWRKYRIGKNRLKDVGKGLIRLGYSTEFSKVAGLEKGYAYFQDFIPKNDSDTRVIVIAGKAIAIKRLVRHNDFRASGSGYLQFEKKLFENKTIELSFTIADKLQTQSLSLDFVFENNNPLIVEISYGFPIRNFIEGCEGYWDRELNWHPGPIDPQGWMVEAVMEG